jgi:hypothetical protein
MFILERQCTKINNLYCPQSYHRTRTTGFSSLTRQTCRFLSKPIKCSFVPQEACPDAGWEALSGVRLHTAGRETSSPCTMIWLGTIKIVYLCALCVYNSKICLLYSWYTHILFIQISGILVMHKYNDYWLHSNFKTKFQQTSATSKLVQHRSLFRST